jgi:cation diffusion facilitator family transporter
MKRIIHYHYSLGERCAWIGMVTNFFLCLGKLYAGYWGSSKALLADGIHTLSDLVSTGIVIVGFKIAKKPPDKTHPYGHGRAEAISTKIIAVMLIIFGLQTGYDSFMTFFSPDLKSPHLITLLVILLSIFIKETLFKYTLHIGNKLSSSSLIADAWHHRSDTYSSIAALVGILGAILGFTYFDPVAGILVSALIVWAGIRIFLIAYNELMDGIIKSETMDEIREIISGISEVKSIKDLKAHKVGLDINVDLTIDIDGNMTVDKGHQICDMVEEEVKKRITSVKKIMIHVNPFQSG